MRLRRLFSVAREVGSKKIKEIKAASSEAPLAILIKRQIRISMDDRGRALDNIFVERLWRSLKYEDIYLKGYSHMAELTLGLTEYFTFYNGERPHQSLSNQVPDQVYKTGKGGGAKIVDKFKSKKPEEEIPVETEKSKVTICGETEKLKLR